MLFESPHSIEYGKFKTSGYFGSDRDQTIAFIYGENGKMYVSDYGEGHADISIKYAKHDKTMFYYESAISGRLFFNVKVISFWTAPEPVGMNRVIKDINAALKRNKINKKIDSSWYIDILVPEKIDGDFDENNEEEIVILINDYIKKLFMYPYVKPSFSTMHSRIKVYG